MCVHTQTQNCDDLLWLSIAYIWSQLKPKMLGTFVFLIEPF